MDAGAWSVVTLTHEAILNSKRTKNMFLFYNPHTGFGVVYKILKYNL